VDRWGTLLEPPSRGYANAPGELVFYEGVCETLFRATRVGWRVYLLGNEDAVAHGKLKASAWRLVEKELLRQLAEAGIQIGANYVCLDLPVAGSGQGSDSVFLLPNTGAFYHAAHTDGIDLEHSWVIGDSTLELVAGWRAGCRLAGVRTGQALSDGAYQVEPELVGENLREVLLGLLSLECPSLPQAG
jgi:histidinol phosphatase-like enzyme